MASQANPRVRAAITAKSPSTPWRGLEPLEGRAMLSVSLGSDGWTDITPSADTRVVYVSNSAGNDANGGLSADAPVKSLAKARSLLRSGSPDWMLLKRGDAWTENLASWTHSGRNEQEPMVIGAYGAGERPVLNTGTSVGFNHWVPIAHLSIVGIHFHAHTRDTDSPAYNGTTAGDYGFQSHGKLNNVLVEDAVFDDYLNNVSITGYDGPLTNFTLRRSIVTDAWSSAGKSQGMYAHRSSGVLIEENLFDHNGWNTSVAGAGATIYSHGVYMSSSNSGIVVRGNIISDSASHGMQARSGGIIENNVFLRNPINLQFGGGSPTVKPGGVEGRVTGNVFLDSRDISGSTRGTAMEFSNIKAGAGVVVSNNIMTADTHRKAPAITFQTQADATNLSESVGINDLTIQNNIVYDWWSSWNMSTSFVPGGTGYLSVHNVKVLDNDFQRAAISRLVRHGPSLNTAELYFAGNRYANHDSFSSSGWFVVGTTTTSFNTWKANVEPTAQSVAVGYADPVRSISKYHTSIGGGASLDAFVSEAANQVRGSYDGRYTAAAVINYIRTGFAEGGVVPAGGLLDVPPSSGTGTSADTVAPAVPQNLAVTATTAASVSLAWDASSDNVGVSGYDVFRDGVKVGATSATTYTDSGLDDATSYTYTVEARDAAGNASAASGGVTGTTDSAPDATAPTAPGNLAVTGATSSGISLSWSAATDNVGVTGYSVFRNGAQVGTVTGTTFIDSGLTAATSYTYSVKAYDAAGNISGASDAVTGTTAAAPVSQGAPIAPVSLSLAKVQRNKARLTWTDLSIDELGFYVYTSTDGINWTRYATLAARTGTGAVQYTTGGLGKGTRYFRVTAFGSGGESAATNVVQFTN